jgi:two-component system LytT family response regulator
VIRVAIIDDEPLARRGLAARLAAHADLQLVGDYADAAAAAEGLSRYPADLVLLDVQMPGMSGLDLLRSLDGARPPLAILFTAHAHYAVDAFALDVVDYLLKPLDDARLDAALRRARQRLQALPPPPGPDAAAPAAAWARCFEVRVGRCTRLVRVEELEWLQAEGDYIALHTRGGSHLLRQTLARMQEQLDPALFLRVHRSSIVRLDAVAELRALSNRDALLRLHSGTLVRASRGYVDALRARLRGTG